MSTEAAKREKHRCWNTRHSEKVRAKGRDQYRMHRNEWFAGQSRWRKAHECKGRSISPKLRFEVLQRDGFRCVYCGKTSADVALEVDHILPVAMGGKTERENLVSACWECNAGKKSRQADINRLKKVKV
jgi:5-methylcytosine-specific restriction endonuclease McrA